ncbi:MULTISPECIES: ABC transporter permease [Gemella]|uniref:ABC transporter permease n=1 Tax=Gemella TaxID=1378 RepID=UPI0007681919|nr:MULTISPECIES: branched-chain amino acid ABC transporter permease [Gemella]AME10005.1 branched-chain amino acid ABC transporter permease [Gemella sp. oral taxon 928]AXI26142.1 branched-chain amino acid ABC transporter permease [Gemella sp. ND 6198]
MDLIISAIAQGMLWGLLSLGLFISFRVLNIADMTTEGAYPLGAGVCVICIHNGINPIVATLIAMFAGMVAGIITGFLITICKIPSLLAGILTMTALLSVNLRIMGRPNLSLLNKDTIFSKLSQLGLPTHYDTVLVGCLLSILIILAMSLFFSTELGQALIAIGDNKKMATALGISTKNMTILGLMLANGIISLAGAILAQNNGYSDVNSGIGVIVVALAAIIIGEVIFKDVSFTQRLACIIFGAIIYRLLLVGVLNLNIIAANDFKLISALVITLFLTLSQLKVNKRGGK